jgi:hypothetical protein
VFAVGLARRDEGKAFRAPAAPESLFFAAAKKSNQKKAASSTDLQLATGRSVAIATLGILPRVATADIVSAALRVFPCCSSVGVSGQR